MISFVLFPQGLVLSLNFNILKYWSVSRYVQLYLCSSMFESFSYTSDIKHTVNTETMLCFETSLTRG